MTWRPTNCMVATVALCPFLVFAASAKDTKTTTSSPRGSGASVIPDQGGKFESTQIYVPDENS